LLLCYHVYGEIKIIRRLEGAGVEICGLNGEGVPASISG